MHALSCTLSIPLVWVSHPGGQFTPVYSVRSARSDGSRFISLQASEGALAFLDDGILSGAPSKLAGLELHRIPRFRSVADRTGGSYYDLEDKTLPASLSPSYLRILSRIWAHDIPSLTTVAKHANTDARLLFELASLLPEPEQWDRDKRALATAIGSNTNTPQEFLLDAFDKWIHAETSRAIAANPVVSEQLMTIYRDRILKGDIRVRMDATQDKDAQPELLAALSSDDSVQVCKNIARHAHTPEQTLAYLALHTNVHVRRAVALNPRINEDIQISLLNDTEPYVTRDLMLNKSITSHVKTMAIVLLSTNAQSRLRADAARHISPKDARFSHLLTDYAPDVRQAIAANPMTPSDVLMQILGDDFLPVRARALRALKERSVEVPESLVNSLRPESELWQSDIRHELIAAARNGDTAFIQRFRGIPEYSGLFHEMVLPLMAAIEEDIGDGLIVASRMMRSDSRPFCDLRHHYVAAASFAHSPRKASEQRSLRPFESLQNPEDPSDTCSCMAAWPVNSIVPSPGSDGINSMRRKRPPSNVIVS